MSDDIAAKEKFIEANYQHISKSIRQINTISQQLNANIQQNGKIIQQNDEIIRRNGENIHILEDSIQRATLLEQQSDDTVIDVLATLMRVSVIQDPLAAQQIAIKKLNEYKLYCIENGRIDQWQRVLKEAFPPAEDEAEKPDEKTVPDVDIASESFDEIAN